jgi:putative chitinase
MVNKMKIPEKAKFIIPILEEHEINTDLRKAHFLSQVMHECGDFRLKEENLNYSADGLMKVFGKYFPNIELAKEYEKQPEKIANKVYANRLGNGNEESGDGWFYRGRGFIQLTGKCNYQGFKNYAGVDFVTSPSSLTISLEYLSLSAVWFWNSKNLNQYADEGSDEHVIEAIRRKINGGTNGLEDVIKRFNAIYNV